MLSRGNGVGRRRIHDQTTKLRRGTQIHIIDTDTGSTNHLQPATGGLKHLAADLGPTPHDQSIAERDLGAELLGAEVIRAVHIRELLQKVEPGLAQLLGDQNSGLGVEPRR